MIGKLILGTAQMGMNYGINNKSGMIDLAESIEILNLAYENGINFIDTAPVYGEAQKVIGNFHRLNPVFKFKIISKIPSGFGIHKIDNLIEQFLSEMNIDTIEILHFHSINDYLNIDSESFAYMIERLITSGKVKKMGISIYENSDIENFFNDRLVDIIQVPFNLLDNINQRGKLLRKLKDHGKIIHSRSTFLQGLFFINPNEVIFKDLQPFIYILNEICKKHDIKMDELALHYCLQQELIDNVLIGVDSFVHLKRNIDISTNKLSKEVFDQVDELFVNNKDLINPSKWRVE